MTFSRFSARSRDTQVLVMTGGHPLDPAGFFGMLDDVIYDGLGANWCLASGTASQSLIERPDALDAYDMILCYDVPGQDYRVGQAPLLFEPTEAYKAGWETLLDRGLPLLFLHHAIIGWPLWPRYSEILGGCVVTREGAMVRGRPAPDSGYRFDVTHRITPAIDHPVVEGLAEGFTICDQLYMGEVFEDSLTPLLHSDYDFTAKGFYSLAAAAQGRPDSNDGWTRGPGSNLIGWVRREKNSDLVYIQCGDGPSAYGNDGFRKLIGNSVRWLTRNVNNKES